MATIIRCTLLAFVMLQWGCASRLGDFTLLSSKTVEISRVDLKKVTYSRGIEGSDGRFWFLFIPFGNAPSLEEAVDAALENGNGDFMTSAVIHRTSWTIILFSWESYAVSGDVASSLDKGSRDIEGTPGKFEPIPRY